MLHQQMNEQIQRASERAWLSTSWALVPARSTMSSERDQGHGTTSVRQLVKEHHNIASSIASS